MALQRAPALLGIGGAQVEAYLHAGGKETHPLLIPGMLTLCCNQNNVSGIN